MQIYFHSCLCSYLPRVPILVEDTVYPLQSTTQKFLGITVFLDVYHGILEGAKKHGIITIIKSTKTSTKTYYVAIWKYLVVFYFIYFYFI